MEKADLYPYCLKKYSKIGMKGTVEPWQNGHVSHKFFEAVPHCFIDSYGGLKILQDCSSEHSSETSATRHEERNSIKNTNKPLDKIVIEEKEEEPLAFLKEILRPNLGNYQGRPQKAWYSSES